MSRKPPPPKRPSKVTVPEHCHPLVKVIYQSMRDQGVTYDELEHRSGVLRQTFKSWRTEKRPGLAALEAVLGALGWHLVPVPPLGSLKPETLEAIEEISLDFKTDNDALAAIMARVCNVPVQLPTSENVRVQAKVDKRINRRAVLPGQVELFGAMQ